MIKTALKIFLIFVLLALLLYLYARVNSNNEAQETNDNTADQAQETLFAVEVARSSRRGSSIIKKYFGTVEPVVQNLVYAQINSRIKKSYVREGEQVDKGKLLFELQIDDRDANLRSAKARVAQRRAEYSKAKKLAARGFESQAKKDEALANLEQAKAELDKTSVEMANTKVYAPISGVVDKIAPEIGEWFNKGALLASVVDKSQAKIEFYVPQKDLSFFTIGTEVGVASLGKDVTSRVIYVSALGDANTKNYKIESVLDQEGANKVFFGQDIELQIGINNSNLHYLPSSSLALSSEGEIGVKYLNENNIVNFYPAEISDEDDEGYYLSGLPEELTVITQGQGFVEIGQEVSVAD